jgi:outer membrane protein assembly factor BamD (BamD/ComL family)
MKNILLIFALSFIAHFTQAQTLLDSAQKSFTDGDFETAATSSKQGIANATSKATSEYKALVDILIESDMAIGDYEDAKSVAEEYIRVVENIKGKE